MTQTVAKWVEVAGLSKEKDLATQQECFFEERDEFMEAYKRKDSVEMMDAVADMAFVKDVIATLLNGEDEDDVLDMGMRVYVLSAQAGFKELKVKLACQEVIRSNFTKFCVSPEDAGLSVREYASIGVQAESVERDGYWVIVSLADQEDDKGKKYPKGKILKGIHYEPPQLKAILEAPSY